MKCLSQGQLRRQTGLGFKPASFRLQTPASWATSHQKMTDCGELVEQWGKPRVSEESSDPQVLLGRFPIHYETMSGAETLWMLLHNCLPNPKPKCLLYFCPTDINISRLYCFKLKNCSEKGIVRPAVSLSLLWEFIPFFYCDTCHQKVRELLLITSQNLSYKEKVPAFSCTACIR